MKIGTRVMQTAMARMIVNQSEDETFRNVNKFVKIEYEMEYK